MVYNPTVRGREFQIVDATMLKLQVLNKVWTKHDAKQLKMSEMMHMQ